MNINAAASCLTRVVQRWCAALLLGASTAAPAAILIDTASVGFTTFGPSFSNQLDLFDPALGTLNSVDVSITGGLTVAAATPAICVPGTPGCVPLPYQISLELDIAGLGGRYFTMDNLGMIFPGVAFPDGGSVFGSRAFSLGMQFDALTDLAGIFFPASGGFDIPAPVVGRRADFLDTLVPLDQLLFTWTPSVTGSVLPIFEFGGGASIVVQYDYTPAPSAIGEPPAALILLLALLTLLASRYANTAKRNHG